jgi:hypothetical protein
MCKSLFIVLITAIGFSLAQAQDKPVQQANQEFKKVYNQAPGN